MSSQVDADGEIDAMVFWARNLPVIEIEGFTENDKIKIINNGFADDDACLLAGLHNVWCFDIITDKGFAIINFIKTA